MAEISDIIERAQAAAEQMQEAGRGAFNAAGWIMSLSRELELARERLRRVEAELAEARPIMNELADDLAAEIEGRYSHGIKEHPAMTPKYERDMEPVTRARAFLEKHNDS